VSYDLRPITVAIADSDRYRRAGCERFLLNEPGIALLENITSNTESIDGHEFVDRRIKPRDSITTSENEVARIKRLNPHVMLVNLDAYADQECALLLSLCHQCPRSLIVLLTEETVTDNQIIRALELGARGYLKYDAVQGQLANAVRAVGRGEAWVPRKLLGKIMDDVLNQ